MREQRQIRTRSCHGMPTKRCSANGISNEFFVVDDDEVIILDFPESSKSKAPRTSRNRNEPVLSRVISIDDDDDDDDDGDTKNVHKAGTSSRRNSLDANLHTSGDEDNEDCIFIREKCVGFRLSKCKRTSSTKSYSGTRFGLGPESESESDDSDCEILDGSHRKAREQWEKAFLEKMKKVGKVGMSEEAGPSNLNCDTNFEPSFESRTEEHNRTSSFVPVINPDGGNDNSPTYVGTEEPSKAGLSEEAGPSNFNCDTNFEPGFKSRTEEHDGTSSFVPVRNPDGGKGTDDRNHSTSFFVSQMKEDNRARSWFFSKEKYPWSSRQSPEKQVDHERSGSPLPHFTLSKEPIHQNHVDAVDEQPDKVQVQCETSQSPEENQKKKAADWFYAKDVVEEEDTSKSSPLQTSNAKGFTPHVLNTASNGARSDHGISSLGESMDLNNDPIPSTSGQVQGLHDTAPEIDIMLNREKLKETDEYKKAQEEEWESRQRQLQLQAEEVQRQRKRIKLANTRQLEMERRQKERVEEVRESQKKDEESMNMKEKLRAEITKSLKLLEIKSSNMASLLRGLGIHVGGGTSPSPHEVHAAYKRAALKFHPDRAARGDIKQQVESEEKFKLIGRMKDKFLS